MALHERELRCHRIASCSQEMGLVTKPATETVVKRYKALLRMSSSQSPQTPKDIARKLASELHSLLDFDSFEVLVYKQDTSELLWRCMDIDQTSWLDAWAEETPAWWTTRTSGRRRNALSLVSGRRLGVRTWQRLQFRHYALRMKSSPDRHFECDTAAESANRQPQPAPHSLLPMEHQRWNCVDRPHYARPFALRVSTPCAAP